MELRSVRAAKVTNKRVLVRAELNVARSSGGRIIDDSRLRAVLPTLQYLQQHRARIIIATHLGRPNGRRVPALSTRQLSRPLAQAMHAPVAVVDDCIGPVVERRVQRLRPGEILLLENTRFHRGDEENDPAFVRSLARLADVFVLESFGTAHRRHASVVGIGKYLPSYAGLRFVEEVQALSRILKSAKKPFAILLGGAKISTKFHLISQLLPRVDALLLGGALANTILKAQGLQVGASLIEEAMVRRVRALKLTNPKLHIPVDVVVSQRSSAPRTRAVGAVRPGESIRDIGPDTVELFTSILRTARTIVWNGPMGRYEEPPFNRGTRNLARVVARCRAYTVVGGGETVDALRSQRLLSRIDFVSTGGGAMVEFLEGKSLPGVELVRR